MLLYFSNNLSLNMQVNFNQCVKCHRQPANPGRTWCQQCYLASLSQTCTNCHRQPANPGRAWCETCFQANRRQVQPVQSPANSRAFNLCTNCYRQPANPGHNWCQSCFLRQRQQPNMPVSNNNNCIQFYDSNKPYYEFTNFYSAPITIGNKSYPTSEHYYQSMKFEGTPLAERIRLANSPRDAWNVANQNRQFQHQSFNNKSLDVMRTALRAKFTQHPNLRQLLKGTGSAQLVEHTANDSFWGDGGNGTGQNNLGKLLMELRSQL